MRTLVISILATAAIAAQQPADTRSGPAAASRPAAESGENETPRDRMRYDQEIARLSKPEPEPKMPPPDPRRSRFQMERDAEALVKESNARARRETDRRALLEGTIAARRAGVPYDRLAGFLARRAADAAAEKAAREAAASRRLEETRRAGEAIFERNSRTDLKAGQRRRARLELLRTFTSPLRAMEHVQIREAKGIDAARSYAREHGIARPDGAEFVVVEILDNGVGKVLFANETEPVYAGVTELKGWGEPIE